LQFSDRGDYDGQNFNFDAIFPQNGGLIQPQILHFWTKIFG